MAQEYVQVSSLSSPRLEQLAALYDQASADADEAASRLATLKAAIKAELFTAAGGSTRVQLNSPHLAAPLRLLWVPRTEVDAKRLRTEAPELFEQFKRDASRWELRKGPTS